MEQWSQAREHQAAEKQEQRAEEHRQKPEQERLRDAGLMAQAVLAGRSPLEMHPERLEELAGWVGNSAMEAILATQGPTLEECSFQIPRGGLDTTPFPVPEGKPALIEPETLPGPEGGQAFDAAYL